MEARPQARSTTARCCWWRSNDRRVRIEVGHGLEGALPDATANRIIQLDITPPFKRGDYYDGINTGVDRIMRVIEGEPLPEPEINPPAADIPGLFNLLPFLFIFALVGGSIFRRLFGRVGGALATGGLVGLLTWLLVSILGISVVAGIVAFIFSLFGGMGGGGGGDGWASRRHRSGWGYPGGIGGGGWGGGGGFGGGGSAAAAAASGAAAPPAAGEPHGLETPGSGTSFATRGELAALLPVGALTAIEQAVSESELTHSGEIRFAIEAALDPAEIAAGKTPRQRALEVFAALGVWDTEANNGVLIYVLSRTTTSRSSPTAASTAGFRPTEWAAVCDAMEVTVPRGAIRAGRGRRRAARQAG